MYDALETIDRDDQKGSKKASTAKKTRRQIEGHTYTARSWVFPTCISIQVMVMLEIFQ